MSNWTSVIVTWSGHEKASEDRRLQDEILDRILAAHGGGDAWLVRQACGGTLAGTSCCEFVAVSGINRFSPGEALSVLHEYGWECPWEVELMWKTEEDDVYQCARLKRSPFEVQHR